MLGQNGREETESLLRAVRFPRLKLRSYKGLVSSSPARCNKYPLVNLTRPFQARDCVATSQHGGPQTHVALESLERLIVTKPKRNEAFGPIIFFLFPAKVKDACT